MKCKACSREITEQVEDIAGLPMCNGCYGKVGHKEYTIRQEVVGYYEWKMLAGSKEEALKKVAEWDVYDLNFTETEMDDIKIMKVIDGNNCYRRIFKEVKE